MVGTTNYALEAFHLLGAVSATATPKKFMSLPGVILLMVVMDLRTIFLLTCSWSTSTVLDYYLATECANVSKASIVRTSKSLHSLLQISTQFDRTSGITPVSLHHTRSEYGTHLELILKEFVVDSHVFLLCQIFTMTLSRPFSHTSLDTLIYTHQWNG